MTTTGSTELHLSPLHRLLLTLALLASISAGAILLKLQNTTCVEHCSPDDTEKPVFFEQPVLQTVFMTGGELLCLLVPLYQSMYTKRTLRKQDDDTSSEVERLQDSSDEAFAVEATRVQSARLMKGAEYLILWIPAAMDVIGSVLMYFLFIYIPPSLYLLLRGLTVVFSGLLAFKFLGRRLSPKQLASLVVVFSGIFISTLPEIRSHDPTPSSTHSSVVLGILLALIAQFLGGAQSVVEEAIFRRYTIEPILLAGMEGVFGLATIAVLTTAFYMMAGPEYLGGPMDLSLAVHQMVSTPRVLYTMLIFLVTQAFGYYFSLTFTRHMGATSRLTVDLCRTVLVWMISLAMGWETLNFVRVVGFSVLVYGYIAYDGSAKLPFFG